MHQAKEQAASRRGESGALIRPGEGQKDNALAGVGRHCYSPLGEERQTICFASDCGPRHAVKDS
jgi:hypothetical protein